MPSVMSEEKREFTVTDRRHFTADGQVRPSPAEEPAPRPADPRPAATPSVREAEIEGVDFGAFLVSLGAQAAQRLEASDLPGARSLIAILEMLQDKTQGRRSAEEDRVLDELLYELRMAYVARAGTGGA